MSDKVLVKVENVSKKFCRSLKRSLWYGVQDIAGELLGRNGAQADLRSKEFWAIKDISFELRRGESLGLIGRNGAGKSTLLRLLNGLIKPDEGRITVRGRTGALIELGAGFNPILTGRENVYVNAAVLGIPRRVVDEVIDEIVDFAELHEFIDTPVQSYSSGMKVRLGFAVAAQLEPDVLLIDEVLAVGDFGFQTKCYARLNELRKSGGATILVSHNMPHIVQYADRCVWLHRGKIVESGNTRDVCAAYLGFMQAQAQSTGPEDDVGELFGGTFDTGDDVRDIRVRFINRMGEPAENVSAFEPVWIDYNFITRRTGPLGLTFKIHRQDGMLLFMINNLLDRVEIRARNGKVAGRVCIDALNLLPGDYVLVTVVQEGVEYLYRVPAVRFNITREGQEHDLYSHGVIQMPHEWQQTQQVCTFDEEE